MPPHAIWILKPLPGFQKLSRYGYNSWTWVLVGRSTAYLGEKTGRRYTKKNTVPHSKGWDTVTGCLVRLFWDIGNSFRRRWFDGLHRARNMFLHSTALQKRAADLDPTSYGDEETSCCLVRLRHQSMQATSQSTTESGNPVQLLSDVGSRFRLSECTRPINYGTLKIPGISKQYFFQAGSHRSRLALNFLRIGHWPSSGCCWFSFSRRVRRKV